MIRKENIVYFAIVGFLLVIIVVLLLYLNSEASKCMKNPYIYGAGKMGGVECSCEQFIEGMGCPAIFSFNSTNMDTSPTVCRGQTGLVQKIRINFSKLYDGIE
jgi:hypothetical protein